MDSEVSNKDGDILLRDLQKHRIAFFMEGANEAYEREDYETAEELYTIAVDHIDEYRDNISDIRDRATLDEEDQRNLEQIESELTNIEQGIEEQLDSLSRK